MYSDAIDRALQEVREKMRKEFTIEDLIRNIKYFSEGLSGPELYDLYEACYIRWDDIRRSK